MKRIILTASLQRKQKNVMQGPHCADTKTLKTVHCFPGERDVKSLDGFLTAWRRVC